MIKREDLPEDAAEWAAIEVGLPRLDTDRPEACPVPVPNILEYVECEIGDANADPSRLVFLRTALVGQDRFWIWEYTEQDGERCFVTCQVKPDGDTCLGLGEPNGLNAEQYALAEYYDEVYWS